MAQSKHTLKVALFSPKPSTASIWFEKTRKEVADKSKGRLELQMFYGSSMGPMPRHYDLARKGVADMSFFQHGVTPGRFPLTELTHAPYLFPPGAKGAVVGAKVAGDLLPKYFQAEHEKAGTRGLWIVFNRPSGVYDSKKPIMSVADLNGRRYRAPTPTDVLMMKALGAAPIGMPATHMADPGCPARRTRRCGHPASPRATPHAWSSRSPPSDAASARAVWTRNIASPVCCYVRFQRRQLALEITKAAPFLVHLIPSSMLGGISDLPLGTRDPPAQAVHPQFLLLLDRRYLPLQRHPHPVVHPRRYLVPLQILALQRCRQTARRHLGEKPTLHAPIKLTVSRQRRVAGSTISARATSRR